MKTLSILIMFMSLSAFAADEQVEGQGATPPPVTEAQAKEAEVVPAMALTPPSAEELKKLKRTPIWEPFKAALRKCTPDCEPVGVLSLLQMGKPSCLTTGHSLNLHGIQCGKGKKQHTHRASEGGRYEEMIQCIGKVDLHQKGLLRKKPRMQFLKTFYRTGPERVLGFQDLSLISLGCVTADGQNRY